jgi:hypothetical protein
MTHSAIQHKEGNIYYNITFRYICLTICLTFPFRILFDSYIYCSYLLHLGNSNVLV